MNYGLDLLGIAKFKDIAIRNFPRNFACGFFAEEFGDAWLAIEQLIKTGKCPAVRCQALWTNHTYDPNKHNPSIMRHLRMANGLKAKYPSVRFQFSPVCEHNIHGQQLTDLLNRCGDASRDVEIVNNPFQGDFSDRFMNEVHGDKQPPNHGAFNYSYDGTSVLDSDVTKDKRTYAIAQIFFFWHQSFNGKYKVKLGNDEAPNVQRNDTLPGKQRECWPTPELISLVAAQAQDKGATKLENNQIWKSSSDRHYTPPEPRAYKPVFITPVNADRITLQNAAGRVMANSSARENYIDGRFRYYFAKFGNQISMQPLNVVANGKVIGAVSPAFRDGAFR